MEDIRSSGVVNLRNADWNTRYNTFEEGDPLTYPILKNFGGFALENYIYGTLTYDVPLHSAKLIWEQPLPATCTETFADNGGSAFVHKADD